MVTVPGSFFDPNYVIGFGTSHGTPYLYDRTVPLLVRAPGFVAAGRSIEAPIDAVSFHDTAATLLGLPLTRSLPAPFTVPAR
jgi:hypothetical protein